MEKKLFDSLMQGVTEAVAFHNGNTEGCRVTTYPIPDVRQVRKRAGMTQAEFSKRYRIPIDSLRAWETRRRNPDQTAQTLLILIERDPEGVARLLETV